MPISIPGETRNDRIHWLTTRVGAWVLLLGLTALCAGLVSGLVSPLTALAVGAGGVAALVAVTITIGWRFPDSASQRALAESQRRLSLARMERDVERAYSDHLRRVDELCDAYGPELHGEDQERLALALAAAEEAADRASPADDLDARESRIAALAQSNQIFSRLERSLAERLADL